MVVSQIFDENTYYRGSTSLDRTNFDSAGKGKIEVEPLGSASEVDLVVEVGMEMVRWRRGNRYE